MEPIKHCPFCGHEAAQIYTQPASGQGGVPRHRVACHMCGALSDFFDCFVHGRTMEHTQEKAVKAWNRRARHARNEELADLVGEIRKLLRIALKGCQAKTASADKARDALSQILGTDKTDGKLDMVLPLAKRFEIKEWDVNRNAR